MSLKTFHIIFITAAILLLIFTGVWAIGTYQLNHTIGYLSLIFSCFSLAAALCVYEYFILKKSASL